MNAAAGLSRLRTLPWRRALIGALVVALVAGAGLVGFLASQDLAAIEQRLLRPFEAQGDWRLRYASVRREWWPRPRLRFEGVTLEHSDGRLKLRAPRVEAVVQVVDLLNGAVDQPRFRLFSPEIALVTGPMEAIYASPRALNDAMAQALAPFGAGFPLAGLHIEVFGARVTVAAGSGEATTLEPVDADLTYRASPGRIELRARRATSVRPLELDLAVPAPGSGPARIALSGFGSRLSFTGTLSRGPEITLDGALSASIDEAIERVLGLVPSDAKARPAGAEPTAVQARTMLDARGIALRNLSVSQGGKSLSGVAALREANGRWNLAATLAGDLIDGTRTHRALTRLRQPDGSWSREALVLQPAPGLDLDMRLSTLEFKLGSIVLQNAALSVLTRRDRAEYAIADSRFGEGALKARVILGSGGIPDLRLALSGENIEVGPLLDAGFGLGRIRGRGSFVVQAESRGSTMAEWMAGLNGSAAFDLKNGEIGGIDLSRLLARANTTRPELALVAALTGRTAFQQMAANFALRDGRLEPIGTRFAAGAIEASLEGAIDIGAGRHDLSALLQRKSAPNAPPEAFAFRLQGPLLAPSVKPDPTRIPGRS